MLTDRRVGSPQSKWRRQRTSCRPRKLFAEMLEGRLLLAAQTTGLFQNDPGTAGGYVLFSPNTTTDTYLIDKEGEVFHEWNFANTPGLLGYLQEDGSLIRSAQAASGGGLGNGQINAAGAGGRIEHVDWDGTAIWSFDYGVANTATDTTSVLQHHDFEVMPNGNILMIAWEYKTAAEAIAAGRIDDPESIGMELYPDHIVEVDPNEPVEDAIVWEWHVWDHLGADDPGKIDINYISEPTEGGGALNDWTHANGIDYNPELDQILLSVREFSEFWIIDHSIADTTGPAGDLLYRWGNPQTYGAGDASDRQLFFQHDAKWVTDDSPGAGNITVFDNGYFGPADPDVSSVLEITTPVDAFGNYPALAPGVPHGPALPTSTYNGAEADFSAIISGTQRLENGNNFITYGVDGTLSEVTSGGTEVWRYVSPYTAAGVLGEEETIDVLPFTGGLLFENFVFRAIHYPPDFAPQLETFVTGRHLFYNNSGFDGNTPGAVGSTEGAFNDDFDAVATDKSAYLPGSGLSSDANATSYSKGINGIMVELTGPHGTLTAADFQFNMSGQNLAANNTPSSWVPVPNTPSITVFSDVPAVGTDRVHIIFPDGDILNRHLEVTVEGNDAAGGSNTNTGLAATDIFYFTNKIADTFVGFPGFFNTDATDEIDARNNQGTALLPTNAFDFNKDFFVDATDQIAARNNPSFMAVMNISNPPAAPAPAGGDDDGAGSAVASALADASVSSDAAAKVRAEIDLPAVARESASAPARRFWQQLGAASDARASITLVALDAIDEALDLDEWLDGTTRRL